MILCFIVLIMSLLQPSHKDFCILQNNLLQFFLQLFLLFVTIFLQLEYWRETLSFLIPFIIVKVLSIRHSVDRLMFDLQLCRFSQLIFILVLKLLSQLPFLFSLYPALLFLFIQLSVFFLFRLPFQLQRLLIIFQKSLLPLQLLLLYFSLQNQLSLSICLLFLLGI